MGLKPAIFHNFSEKTSCKEKTLLIILRILNKDKIEIKINNNSFGAWFFKDNDTIS